MGPALPTPSADPCSGPPFSPVPEDNASPWPRADLSPDLPRAPSSSRQGPRLGPALVLLSQTAPRPLPAHTRSYQARSSAHLRNGLPGPGPQPAPLLGKGTRGRAPYGAARLPHVPAQHPPRSPSLCRSSPESPSGRESGAQGTRSTPAPPHTVTPAAWCQRALGSYCGLPRVRLPARGASLAPEVLVLKFPSSESCGHPSPRLPQHRPWRGSEQGRCHLHALPTASGPESQSLPVLERADVPGRPKDLGQSATVRHGHGSRPGRERSPRNTDQDRPGRQRLPCGRDAQAPFSLSSPWGRKTPDALGCSAHTRVRQDLDTEATWPRQDTVPGAAAVTCMVWP